MAAAHIATSVMDLDENMCGRVPIYIFVVYLYVTDCDGVKASYVYVYDDNNKRFACIHVQMKCQTG